jgi:hypothetical protein
MSTDRHMLQPYLPLLPIIFCNDQEEGYVWIEASLSPCQPLGSSLPMARTLECPAQHAHIIGVAGQSIANLLWHLLTTSPGASLGGVERELWKLLPARLKEAWESSGHRISSGEVEVRLPFLEVQSISGRDINIIMNLQLCTRC